MPPILKAMPLLLLTAWITLLAPTSAAGEERVALTGEERQWLEEHSPIRVANETDWPPFDFAEAGAEKGYSIDLLKLAAEKTGLNLRFINGYAWKKLLQMGRERKIDLFPCIWKNPERETFLTFTPPYIDTPQILVVRREETGVRRIEDLEGRVLAGVRDYASTNLVKKHFPAIRTLEVSTPLDGLRQLAYGKADAYLGTLGSTVYQIRQKMIHGLKVAGETNIGGHIKIENLHMATRRDWPLLASILKKGLDAVTLEERLALQDKWIAIPGPDALLRLPLTLEEKAWLRDREALRFRVRPRPPLAIVEGDRLAGILGEYLAHFTRAVGVETVVGAPLAAQGDPWEEGADFLLLLEDEHPTAADTAASEPLLTIPLAIVTRTRVGFIENLGMIKGETVAVSRTGGLLPLLERRYPRLSLVEADDDEAALEMVADRRAFAMVNLAPIAQYHMAVGLHGDLKISGMTPEKVGVSLVVREENVLLARVMNKVLLSMPQADKEAIYRNWVRVRVREKIDYALVGWVAAGLSFLLLMALFWNRSLQREAKRRRRAEMRARGLADQQKAVVDHSPVGIAFFDQNRVIRQANSEMERILGANPEELVGQTTRAFFLDEEAFRDFGARAYPVLRTGAVFEEEILVQRLTGERFWCRLRGVAVDKENLEEGFVWTTEDITIRREIGEKLRQAKEAAESASRSKTLFLAHMSHEIRTPLNAILGMNEVLIESDLSPDQRKYLQTSKNAGETLLALINDVLDLSKIEAGQMDLTHIDYNLPKLIERTADMQATAAQEKGVGFRVDLDPELPRHVRGDPDRLRQVLLNLLNNAVKFTLAGQVTFSVRREQDRLVRFTVRDTGIGMNPEQTDRIFKPFVQAASDTNRRFGGTGLGLTICKLLVDAMGGAIEVESRQGEGSAFHVTLEMTPSRLRRTRKARPGEPENPTDLEAEGPAPGAPLTILLVDDSEQNRMVISAFLRKSPHRLIQAANGAKAVAAFQDGRVDMIFMDMLMPVMDGYEATRKIRALEEEGEAGRTPIIALTAQALKADLDKTIEAGCNFHLTKPIRKSHLLEVIERFRPPDDA